MFFIHLIICVGLILSCLQACDTWECDVDVGMRSPQAAWQINITFVFEPQNFLKVSCSTPCPEGLQRFLERCVAGFLPTESSWDECPGLSEQHPILSPSEVYGEIVNLYKMMVNEYFGEKKNLVEMMLNREIRKLEEDFQHGMLQLKDRYLENLVLVQHHQNAEEWLFMNFSYSFPFRMG